MIKAPVNPLLDKSAQADYTKTGGSGFPPKSLEGKAERKTALLREARERTADEAIPEIVDGTEVILFSRGAFCQLDVITTIVNRVAPVERLWISTWTVAHLDIDKILAYGIEDVRWLLDVSMPRRAPEQLGRLRQEFGVENVRLGKIHAKACMIDGRLPVVLLSSANLNLNRRDEHAVIRCDRAVFDFTREWYLEHFA